MRDLDPRQEKITDRLPYVGCGAHGKSCEIFRRLCKEPNGKFNEEYCKGRYGDGRIVCKGALEEVAKAENSDMGRFLKKVL